MNEKEKILTNKIINICNDEKIIIPHHLLYTSDLRLDEIGLFLEMLSLGLDNAKDKGEWTFSYTIPIVRGQGTHKKIYRKPKIKKMLDNFLKINIIQSYFFEKDTFSGLLHIENIYSDLLEESIPVLTS